VYIHCPLITNEEHQKLSKRSGHSSFEDLIEQGFVEEAVVNVMSYGYPDNKVGLVDIDMESDGKWITITITDSGIPFDPTKKEEVDITLPADQRPIGGLGIYLVRNIMDTVEYQNINNQNILILRKELNKE